MRILILSINYWPEVAGIGAFTTYRAEYLAAAGHDVEVCTTFPYYPQWKVPAPYSGKLAMSEFRNGVRIRRAYAYVPRRVTAVRRILHEASFVASATLRSIARRRPDVLLAVSPPLGLGLAAILLSRMWRIPYVFDVEDLQPDSAVELGMLPRPAVKLLYRLESAAYRHARLVTTLTAAMKERIVSKGVRREKVELLEPRMDETLTALGEDEAQAFRARYHLGDSFLVSYSGNIGVKQKLDAMIEAAALNRDDGSILFLIVGQGADSARIQRRARELELRNLRFLPLLDEADFRGLLAASQVCLVTQQKAASDIAFPSKLVTYLAAGRPVVASVNPDGEVARVVRESGAGRVTAAEDPEALIRAILELSRANLQELACRARAYASRRWAPERVLGQLERTLLDAAMAAPTIPQEEPTR